MNSSYGLSIQETREEFEDTRGKFESQCLFMIFDTARNADGDYKNMNVHLLWAGWCLCLKSNTLETQNGKRPEEQSAHK